MKKYTFIIYFILICYNLYSQSWTPGIAALPQPDTEGYLHASEGHYAVWKDNGLLRQGMKIRFNNAKISMQSGSTIYISGNYPSIDLQDIVPNEFLNVSLNIWLAVSELTAYSTKLQLVRIEIVGGNRIWAPKF